MVYRRSVPRSDQPAQRDGFTLVELSIVLVIVGLLIGGILVGQSLIESAKINAQIAQIQQFDSAVMAFKSKYKYLPGDAPAFGGDGDGALTMGCCGKWTGNLGSEMLNFWNNLFPNVFTTKYTLGSDSKANYGGLKNVPLSKMGSNNAYLISVAISTNGYHADMTNIRNVYAILDGSQVQTQISGNWSMGGTNATNSSVKPGALAALDQKADDGIANSGYVVSGGIAGYQTNQGAVKAIPNTSFGMVICSIGASYLISSDSNECTPVIRIGGSTGNPL